MCKSVQETSWNDAVIKFLLALIHKGYRDKIGMLANLKDNLEVMMAENTNVSTNENQSIVEQNELQQTSLLETLEKLQKKHLFYQRISCLLILVFVVATLSILPSLFRTLSAAEEALDNANSVMLQAEDTLEDISDLVVVSEKQINDAMKNLNDIDFEGLNSAIADLEAVVAPLADFFGNFR